MPQKKEDESKVAVGNIHGISGEVNIAGGDIVKGYTAEQISVLLTQISSSFQAKPFDGRCPYKGLDVFEEEDAELFFGREKSVDDLLSRVKELTNGIHHRSIRKRKIIAGARRFDPCFETGSDKGSV